MALAHRGSRYGWIRNTRQVGGSSSGPGSSVSELVRVLIEESRGGLPGRVAAAEDRGDGGEDVPRPRSSNASLPRCMGRAPGEPPISGRERADLCRWTRPPAQRNSRCIWRHGILGLSLPPRSFRRCCTDTWPSSGGGESASCSTRDLDEGAWRRCR